jgi:hypothetical protein
VAEFEVHSPARTLNTVGLGVELICLINVNQQMNWKLDLQSSLIKVRRA